ncbi:MAG: M15 family metallopeptidase [Nocardioides sp.]
MRVGRMMAAVVLPLALLGGGCQGGTADAHDPASTPAGASSGATPSTPAASGSPVGDPDHAVAPPPARRQGRLYTADMLVYSQDALRPDMVARIKHLKGVTSVEQLSLANVSIENHALTVAAVDPATYRNWTPQASADTQAVWDRVAGGEVALLPELRKQLPIDKSGYLKLGSSKAAPDLHVGAFAPQGPNNIDAVVNDKWAQSLGMKQGNALLIYTGITSPSSLRKPVERIAGTTASVQSLDIVARAGLDIHAKQTAFLVGSVADAVGTFNYTVLGGGHIAPDPSWVASHIATQQVPILGSVTCNRLLFPQLTAALNEIVDQGLAHTIHPSEYAGCYYPRFIAGTTTLSNHSFGLALDINAIENQRGTAGRLDPQVVAIFEKWGFTWGGTWHYTDPMHFEMNSLVKPG